MRGKFKIKLLINSISKNKTRIFRQLKLREKDLEKYFYIKEEYKKGNIENLEFECVYKDFYKMNMARLTDNFFKEYFELLASNKIDLKNFLRKLENKSRGIQFSFVTKLLHTKNNNLPIYDSLVGKAMGLKVIGKNKDDKIKSCCEVYKTLQQNYYELLNNKTVKKIILDFRNKFNCDEKKMSDTKVLDSLLWAKGQLSWKNEKEKFLSKEQKLQEREKEHQLFVQKLNELSRKNPQPLKDWLEVTE